MPVPKVYQRSQETAIASYDWTDIASGSGYLQLYGCMANRGNTTEYILIDNIMESSTKFEDDEEATVGITNGTSINIDSFVFNLPRTLKGRPYIVSYILQSGGGTNYFDYKIILIKADNTTEDLTDLKRGLSATDNNPARNLIFFDDIDVHIKKGEKIRVYVTFPNIAGNNQTPKLGLSPTGKIDVDGYSKQFVLGLPFDLDL